MSMAVIRSIIRTRRRPPRSREQAGPSRSRRWSSRPSRSTARRSRRTRRPSSSPSRRDVYIPTQDTSGGPAPRPRRPDGATTARRARPAVRRSAWARADTTARASPRPSAAREPATAEEGPPPAARRREREGGARGAALADPPPERGRLVGRRRRSPRAASRRSPCVRDEKSTTNYDEGLTGAGAAVLPRRGLRHESKTTIVDTAMAKRHKSARSSRTA